MAGVVPEGFERPPLEQILGEIEASLVTEFGPNVIQSPQSPLGQINGLFSNFVAQLWELAEDTYQSWDVDAAEGRRLDIIAKMRIMRRAGDESDPDFRNAITNQGQARIDVQDIVRAVKGISGVTYAQVFLNDNSEVDENLIPPGSMAVAVLGGDEQEIADALRRFVVPGITTVGNTYVTTNMDGFCRTMTILRPVIIPVTLTIQVRLARDIYGCPPPSAAAIRDATVADLRRLLVNGDDINHFRVRSVVERLFPNVEVVNLLGTRPDNQTPSGQVAIAFIELAEVSTDRTMVEIV